MYCSGTVVMHKLVLLHNILHDIVCIIYMKYTYMYMCLYIIITSIWKSGKELNYGLKSANINFHTCIIWQSLTKPPNFNPPIPNYFLQWQFGAQPPNLIISGILVATTLQ